jgi:amino acid permease
MVISKQHNYVKNKNYMTWVYILIVKTTLALITAYCLEFIAKFIPQNSRRLFLKYSRLICFFLLFIISGINREWRETQLIHHKGKKSSDKKKDDDMKMDNKKKDD